MTELILALDVRGGKEALAIAEACAPYIDRIKLGYPLVLAAGLAVAGEMAALGRPLIADFKVADIPNTNRLIAEEVFAAGFSSLIAHAFTGSDAVAACVDVAHANGGECYVVAEMSHPGAVEFFHGGVAERLAETAVACGADGIIAPATRPGRIARLREIVGNRAILSPGVGTQGGEMERVAPLVDGVIVGRSIYEAPDPAAAAAAYAALRR
ncbi:MAG: orotidine-5'-phosphate decarboxylase [Methanomicrobiales archaeon]|nr:orotidine-5'-phosphate decarboxylase [Methanomicrobiales archaeon]